MRLWLLTLLVISLTIIGVVNAPIQETHPTDTNLNPEETREYFDKVANVPYKADMTTNTPKTPNKFWQDGYGDCDDKAVAFLDYLYTHGERNISLVTLSHESGEYSHACLLWNNQIYDPTITPPVYNMEKERYYKTLQELGFTSRYTTPYKGGE